VITGCNDMSAESEIIRIRPGGYPLSIGLSDDMPSNEDLPLAIGDTGVSDWDGVPPLP